MLPQETPVRSPGPLAHISPSQPAQVAPDAKHTRTFQAHIALASDRLLGHPFYREFWNLLGDVCFRFSSPARVPSEWKFPGIPPAHACISFTYPTGCCSEHPGILLPTLAFVPVAEWGTHCPQHLGTPQLAPSSAFPVLPGRPQCGEP